MDYYRDLLAYFRLIAQALNWERGRPARSERRQARMVRSANEESVGKANGTSEVDHFAIIAPDGAPSE